MEELDMGWESTLDDRYLVFSVGDAAYAMGISNITEIVELPPITVVPGMPDYMTGIINLRGAIIPVMNARGRFGYEPAEYTQHTCIVVIQQDELCVGLLVDAVCEVTDINPDDITEPPTTGLPGERHFVKGVGKAEGNVQLIIDCDILLDCIG